MAAMKIAFISYEYPTEMAAGGIATYVRQAANMLQHRGHQVEVFTASSRDTGGLTEPGGVLVHRILTPSPQAFSHKAAERVVARHAQIKFDVMEGPDYGADSFRTAQQIPSLPLVVKLHMPVALYWEYNGMPRWRSRLRTAAGALRDCVNPFLGKERVHCLLADEVSAPARDIAEKLIIRWRLNRELVHVVPYPYAPSREMLDIPIDTDWETVTFLGRLELKKGVIDVAEAIPTIRREFPRIRFRFVGKPVGSPALGLNMTEYLRAKLADHTDYVEFTGPVPLQAIPDILSRTDICVLPSHWENFPNVCLEAMGAGRGVIGSSSGGMADMLSATPEVGLLIPPRDPAAIAAAVIQLLRDPIRRKAMGAAARARVLETYHPDRIGKLQEAGYERAIARRAGAPR